MKDYYFILGIGREAGSREIKEAFRMLCLKYHPDKTITNPHNEARYMEICEAYKLLSNKEKKAAYDKKLIGIPEQNHSLKEELHKIKGAIYPEIKTSYKGHYPWFAAFAIIIVGTLSLIFSWRTDKSYYSSKTGEPQKIITPVAPPAKQISPAANKIVPADTAGTTAGNPPVDSAELAKADSAKKIEAYIVSTFKQYTPYQISKVKAANGGVVPYNERDYQYSFRDKKLFVSFREEGEGKTTKNRVVIPAKDVETVYYYNNKIWISSRRKSIRVYDLTSGDKYNTEFFSVKFDTDNPGAVGKELTDAFRQLKSL